MEVKNLGSYPLFLLLKTIFRYLTKIIYFVLLYATHITSLAALSFSPEDTVQHGISIASGTGVAEILPFRIGIQRSFGCRICPRNASEDWPIRGYWEASACTMRGKKGPYPHSPRQINALAAAGVFRVERRCPFQGIWPYLDIGIGVSWISKREISGRELGIHFQFEDRLGLGFRFGQNREYDLSYRAIHFSNAYLHSRNASVNLHLIVLGFWF